MTNVTHSLDALVEVNPEIRLQRAWAQDRALWRCRRFRRMAVRWKGAPPTGALVCSCLLMAVETRVDDIDRVYLADAVEGFAELTNAGGQVGDVGFVGAVRKHPARGRLLGARPRIATRAEVAAEGIHHGSVMCP